MARKSIRDQSELFSVVLLDNGSSMAISRAIAIFFICPQTSNHESKYIVQVSNNQVPAKRMSPFYASSDNPMAFAIDHRLQAASMKGI